MRKAHKGLDKTDRKIVELLQQNGRMSNIALARKLGLAAPSVLNRVRHLEAQGVIDSYHAHIDPAALNLKLLAFVYVRIDGLKKENIAGERISRLRGVQEVHFIAGEDALLVKVRTSGPEDLAALIREEFLKIDGIISTKTTIALHTMLETASLPVSEARNLPQRTRRK